MIYPVINNRNNYELIISKITPEDDTIYILVNYGCKYFSRVFCKIARSPSTALLVVDRRVIDKTDINLDRVHRIRSNININNIGLNGFGKFDNSLIKPGNFCIGVNYFNNSDPMFCHETRIITKINNKTGILCMDRDGKFYTRRNTTLLNYQLLPEPFYILDTIEAI